MIRFILFSLEDNIICYLTQFSVISCGDPGTIEDSVRLGELFTYGHTVDYICDVGTWFERNVFQVTTICNLDGKWSSRPLKCHGIRNEALLNVFG